MLFFVAIGEKNILNWFAEFSIGWMTFGNYPDNLHFFWQINFSLLLGHVKKSFLQASSQYLLLVTKRLHVNNGNKIECVKKPV